ncbi:hypothetical protein BTHI11S_03457 [Bosea thiooxidans]
MKRIVPPALLALAALVVLPTKTLPTTSPASSRIPVGVAPDVLASPRSRFAPAASIARKARRSCRLP